MKIRPKRYPKVDRKYGEILGIKVSITPLEEVLKFINTRLDTKEKFYAVTPNPENLLMATKDWLLKKAIIRSDLSIPDGIGLAQAYKFLGLKDDKTFPLRPFRLFFDGLKVGVATFKDKSYLTDTLPITKGRELFFEVMKIANDRRLKVYLFGGEHGEQTKSVEILKNEFKNITFKTNYEFPQYNKNAKPVGAFDRKLHKKIIGGIKVFEPDLIIVALNTPKQEKWIYRNFFRLKNTTGAFALGGTFNYVAGNMKLPPDWLASLGLEWFYRFIQEPKRLKRIINAVIIFPWTVFMWKLNPPRRK